MNRKGQALVEFVLILPVLVFILLAVVDFGNILYSKNKLENDSNDIVRMIKNDDIDELKSIYPNVLVDVSDYNDNYKRIVLSMEIDVNTPGLDRIMGDPCKISTERIISYEQ